ncbi:MAG: helix-turn-helix domain-containing protein, partial [Clostridia bacterium]|nr:helix-turn-helix domain-containing protein [Clostridia bacterium]
MENKETLGKRIAMLRKEKGLTQEQLAEKVGVSAQAVSKWENDISCPDITLLPLLADILGVTVDELLGVKPIEPHVIILDKDETPNDEKKKNRSFSWEWNKHKKSARWGTIAFCIGAILVCLLFILRSFPQLGLFLNYDDVTAWDYVWPILIFTVGLISVRDHAIFGSLFMLWGVYEFLCSTIPALGAYQIKWYVVLLVIAVILLVETIIGKKHWVKIKKSHDDEDHTPTLEVSQDDNYLDADMSFGSGVITYDGETLRGGSIDMNFGDYKVDFRNVRTFTDNCLL